MDASIPPIPVLRTTEFDPHCPAYLGNGLIGIRPGPNPLLPCRTVVGGFVGSCPREFNETHVAAPYPLHLGLFFAETDLAPAAVVREQTLDMATGELGTRLDLSAVQSATVRVDVVQYVSRSIPSALFQTLAFQSDRDVVLRVVPLDGTAGLDHRFERIPIPKPRHAGFVRTLLCTSNRSRLGVTVLLDPGTDGTTGEDGVLLTLRAGRKSHLQMAAVMVSGFYHPDPHLESRRIVGWIAMIGFAKAKRDHLDAWERLWRSRIRIEGDARAQQAIDEAFFYTVSSTHPASKLGVPPFGLSQHSNYGGHVFWDMDHWILPSVMLIDPDAVRSMLEYRVAGLQAARRKASLVGLEGAYYPWEAGVDGSCATPPTADTGWGEHHVVPEIAIAFWEYYGVSGDRAFLLETGWPVIREIAAFIASRGRFTDRGYEIGEIVGVDEFTQNVRNDAHMNLLCRMAMGIALSCAELRGVEPPARWREVRDRIVLPTDPATGRLLPYESAHVQEGRNDYSPGVSQFTWVHSPEDLGGLPPETFRANWTFEEEMRARLPSSPSNPCSDGAPGFTTPPFAAWAAFFGEKEKSARLFDRAFTEYRLAPFGVSREYRHNDFGEYLTNHGSYLLHVLLGVTGLRLTRDGLARYPATLPAGWKRIVIDELRYRGRRLSIVVEDGEMAKISEFS